MIIGISGYMGSGKDTVAQMIQWLTSKRYFDYQYILENYKEVTPAGMSHLCGHVTDWEVKKFAGKLKQMVSLLTGIPVEDLEKEEVKCSVLPDQWKCSPLFTPTVRDLLQRLGTDCVRNLIHKNAWVNALFADYTPLLQYYAGGGPIGEPIYPNWIISDMRFPNEMEAIKERGGLTIRVVRPETEDLVTRHESETALDNADFDFVIHNDGSLAYLLLVVKEYLKTQKIIK